MFKIENDLVFLAVDTKGSEICSFKDKNSGIEYMWQGDPKLWSGRNPTLFPMVSNTYNGIQLINGKEYHMKNHGIVRSAEFTCTYHDDNTIVMTYQANEESKQLYPFDFSLDIRYELHGKRVDIIYTITNLDDKILPFGFGLHPAFNCPLEEGEKFEDYHLEFSNTETVNGLLGPLSLHDEKVIPCDYSWLKDNPTIVFENPRSSFVKLTNGKHGVKVGIGSYKYIAFWTKEGAPFMCIEPWHSHGDFSKVDVPFENRPDTMHLAPNRSYTTSYYIELF